MLWPRPRMCCWPTRYTRNRLLLSQMVTACRRTFRCFVRAVAWIPVIFVSAVIVWGYYVYVYVMNISGAFPKGSSPVVSTLVSALLVLIAHVILGLQLVSFVRTIFMKHKPVPEEFQLTEEQVERLEEMVDGRQFLEELSSDLPIHTLSRSGGVRYCDVCEAVKPDRCHHCSFCNKVNNCVGYSNYKFFVLFLFYTMLLCVWFAATGGYDFFRAWNGTLDDHRAEKFNVIFCYFVSVLFGLSTSCLFFFHFYLVLFNRTTLENMQSPLVAGGPDRRLYHLGFGRNIQLVFGSNCLRALLPVTSSEGDGVSFQTRPMRADCELATMGNKHAHLPLSANGHTSGEESEVEILAAEDLEKQPLTKMSQL